MHADCPLKDIACVLFAQTKDATIVCVIGCQITRTRIHTLLERLLLVLAMINKGKLYSYQNARFFKQTSQLKTKKLMMYSPGDPFIMVAPVVTSWAVAGQRMVFLHMYLQTRVTLEAFPVATPRGRSSSSHEGEQIFYSCTYWYSLRCRQFLLLLIYLLPQQWCRMCNWLQQLDQWCYTVCYWLLHGYMFYHQSS